MSTSAEHREVARPWLRPAASALVALADDPTPVDLVRNDPGLVLHVLRYSRPTPNPDTFRLDSVTLSQPGLCETAATLLERDPDSEPLEPNRLSRARACAHVAWELAKKTGLCSPDAAWCIGLLAGYLADHQPTARKQLTRWRLPVWVTLAVGFSDLPIDVLGTMGGHRGLLRVVRAAIRAAVSGAANFEADAELDSLTPFFLEAARQPPASGVSEPGYELLPRLLRFSAKVRHRLASQVVDELEQRVDQLVAVIAQNRQEFDRQVRDAKLAALAEFAAGASHEINNPLAIISTNVQYLRSHEEEPERVETFDAILRQTKRIHEILYGARQFARPPRATPAVVAESAWVAGLAKEVSHDASARRVQLDLSGLHGPTRFWADVTHLRVIAGHLIRNAIEAVPPGGWVRAKCEQAGSNTLLIVEDSGPGPVSAAVPHLFDPFYSGRTAGRGRGLGLAIALRLAQQNNGDLYYDSRSGEPTRFVLRLPSSPPHEAELRRSA